MRHAAVRVLAFSSCLALAACGGSSSKGNDGAAGGDGAAGNDAAADADGAGGGTAGAGGGLTGLGGTSGAGGAAGTAGHDAAADSPAEAGSSSDGGGDVASASDGAGADAPAADGSSDASSDAAPASLCAAISIGVPAAMVTNVDNGKSIDESGFTGGTIPTGTYWLTSVVHFGASYTGPTQEVWVYDGAAKTLEVASLAGTTPAYLGYRTSITASTLSGAAACGTTTAASWNYLVAPSGAGTTLSVNLRGSSDVLLFTKQ